MTKMKITIQQFLTALQKNVNHPVHILVGEEYHLQNKALELLFKEKEKKAQLDKISYVGKELSPEKLFSSLRTISMLSGQPFVVVRDADKCSADAKKALADYLASPVADATLVLLATKMDGRSKFMQQANKVGCVIECKPLYANQVASWLGQEVRGQGKQISQDAAHYLADFLGTDLGQLSQTVERLSIYVGERSAIHLMMLKLVWAKRVKKLCLI